MRYLILLIFSVFLFSCVQEEVEDVFPKDIPEHIVEAVKDSGIVLTKNPLLRYYNSSFYWQDGCFELSYSDPNPDGDMKFHTAILLNTVDLQGNDVDFLSNINGAMFLTWRIDAPENFGLYRGRNANVSDHYQFNIKPIFASGTYDFNYRWVVIIYL